MSHPASVWNTRLHDVGQCALGFHGDVEAALAWSVEVGHWAPKPGTGSTARLWELLATTAAADVGVARILEPHLDALAILDQVPTGVALDEIGIDEASTWGVYAAEGPECTLTAAEEDGSWILSGIKPWCSLAQVVSHAVVTARTSDGALRLFAVDMKGAGVEAEPGPWHSRGLRHVVSAPVSFSRAPAIPLGPEGWYLTRTGFDWGGIGVAACWWGGAIGIARALYGSALKREPDQLALAHLGAVDTLLSAARATLAEASSAIDDPTTSAETVTLLTRRTRNLVAETVESTLTRVGHALGPGPLTQDEEHARRVADLHLYVRQHHAERDEASLGRKLLARKSTPW
nr:acyl-CoA dehydrogenase family protein [Leifsonia psychrotolerans]